MSASCGRYMFNLHIYLLYSLVSYCTSSKWTKRKHHFCSADKPRYAVHLLAANRDHAAKFWRPTCDVSGSCRWRDLSRHSLEWGRTCPLSCQTSTWTGCHSGSRPFASWLLGGILTRFCGTHTSPSHVPDHRSPGPDTWRVRVKCSPRDSFLTDAFLKLPAPYVWISFVFLAPYILCFYINKDTIILF